MRSKINVIICGVVSLLFGTVASSFAQDMSLMALYDRALQKDPKLGQARAYFSASKAETDIAIAAILPRVQASASQRTIKHSVDNYSVPIDGTYQGNSAALSAQLPLLNAASYLQVSAARAGQRSAQASVDHTHQDLMVRLVKAYVQLLKATADSRVYQEDLDRLAKILDQAQAALKTGTGDIISVYEAKARLEGARAENLKAQATQRMAVQEISTITGISVTQVMDINIASPAGPTPHEFTWWVSNLLKNNLSIIQAKEEYEQATITTKANKALHLPTLQLVSGYTYEKGSTFIPELITRQWYAGINLTLPIFNGGETNARVNRAVASEAERRFLYEGAKEQNMKALEEAFLNLQYNMSLIQALKEKLDSSEKQLFAVKKGYTLGTRSILDQLNAEQTWSVSKRDYDAARYDNVVRNLELKAAAGILSMRDLQKITPKKDK